MSATAKNIYAPLPNTERGKSVVLGGDPKGINFLYASGSSIVIRDIKNPLIVDLYQEHAHQTSVAKYSPSGFYICSGDTTGAVRIWDTTQKEHPLKFEMRALGGRINDIDWTEDSKRVVVVGEGREFFGRAFFMDTGASVGEISGHTKDITSCSIKQNRPYRLATVGLDFETHHFNGVPFKWQKRCDSKAKRFVNAVRFNPDGTRYVTGGSDKLIQIYDGKSGDLMSALPVEHKGGVYSLCWSPDGSKLLSASADKSCKTWDMETQKCISTFELGTETMDQQYGCLWQGEFLLSVGLSGKITYLDVNNPSKPHRVLAGHQKFVTSLAHDAESNSFFTGSYDSVITQWHEESGDSKSFTGKGHTSQIEDIDVQAGNLVTASMDGSIRVTPLNTREYTASFNTDTDAVGVACGTKNKSLIVGACLDGLIRIKSGGAASEQVRKHPVDFGSTCIALSVDEKIVAVGGKDKKVHLFSIDGDGFKPLKQLEGHKGAIKCVTFSPDGSWLASSCHGRDIIVWSTDDWSIKTKAWGSFHQASINCLAWNPDSLHLASGSLDQNIFIWTVGKKVKRTKIDKAHQGGVNALTWTSESVLASVGQDNSLKTWDVTF